MRRVFIISAAVHFGLLLLLPVIPMLGDEQPLALEVYAVELVDLPQEARAAEPVVTEPEPEDEAVVKQPEAEPEPEVEIPEEPVRRPVRPVIAPPPKREEKSLEDKIAERLKREEATRPAEQPAEREETPTPPSGTTKITAGRVADYYLTMLQGKITRNWKQPSARFTGGDDLTVRVTFRVLRSGDVTALRVARSSNWSTVDQSAVQAVRASAPFAELPQTYPDDHLDVTIDFTVTQ